MRNDNFQIVTYQPDLAADFKAINETWIREFFELEAKDIQILSNPQIEIIDKGGEIFFVKEGDNIAGAVALIPMGNGIYELSKMGVNTAYQGKGMGKLLIQHCITVAKNKGIKSLILYSNTKLGSAIHLYEKFGFISIPLEKELQYARSDIKMEKIL